MALRFDRSSLRRIGGILRVRRRGDVHEVRDIVDTGSAPTADYENTRERNMRQNAEIDRRMVKLQVEAPTYHRLLDVYYRHGMCYEQRGWELAAKRAGISPRQKPVRHRKAFEILLDLAVKELFLCG